MGKATTVTTTTNTETTLRLDPDPDEVDALLAAELNAMTCDERAIVYEEVHGVEREIPETESFLDDCLLRMEGAIQALPNRELYERAARLDPTYMDRAFRIMFLRCEYFDPEKAAQRMILFLQGKVRFFGDDALARPINLGDFSEEDLAFLKSGIMQIIPSRDRSGRVIMADFNMGTLPQPQNIDSVVRRCWIHRLSWDNLWSVLLYIASFFDIIYCGVRSKQLSICSARRPKMKKHRNEVWLVFSTLQALSRLFRSFIGGT